MLGLSCSECNLFYLLINHIKLKIIYMKSLSAKIKATFQSDCEKFWFAVIRGHNTCNVYVEANTFFAVLYSVGKCYWDIQPSYSWVAGLSSNSTLVSLISRHPYISLFAPAWSPGVLDNPVVFTLHCSISNSENSMVKFGGGATSFVVDSRSV